MSRRAAVLDPLSSTTWASLSEFYQGSGQFALARSACNRWLEIASDAPWARFSQVTIHLLEARPRRLSPPPRALPAVLATG